VEDIMRSFDPSLPYKAVRASRGKWARAEPIASLYEQKRVCHDHPFAELEQQMCSFVPGLPGQSSPDRMDALVWALTELFKTDLNPPVVAWR
jgi:phage terminase large subunit-like protein